DASGIAREGVAAAVGPGAEDFGGARVLMAEDNETNQMVAQEILGPAGVSLDIVGDGRAAVEKAASGAYALVLMDMQMPVLDGIAATKAIRESLGGRAPPIVALTANAMKADVDRCLAAGMVDFVAKPIDRTLLFRTLRKHLPSVPAARKPRAAAAVPTVATSAPAAVDEAAARARLGLSPAAYERILARFREALPATLAALRDALAQGDREASVRHAHSVAGSAGNVGATALHGAAKGLEGALRDGVTEHGPALAAVEREAAAALGAPAGAPVPAAVSDAAGSAAGPAAPVAEVRARAAALREALGAGDLDAIESATRALKVLSLPPGGAGAVKSVEAAAADYDFDRAAAALGEWVKSLG
ncbi:MAG TPA: response regulator, partial [Planctomycetota bacterium]|nr:response regulator [Planctomycetota bacterium]